MPEHVDLPDDPPEDRDLLAAELALGVLDAADDQAARALQRDDRGFAARVATWEHRLAPLLDDVEPHEPAAEVWERIAARIASPATRPALSVAPAPADAALSRRVRAWRGGTIAATALAACLALVLVLRPAPPPRIVQVKVPVPVKVPVEVPVEVAVPSVAAPAPQRVAQLVDTSGTPLVSARFDRDRGALRIAVAGLDRRRDRAPELWVIPKGGVPHSLGQVADAGATTLRPAAALRALMNDGATLAVTLEPVSASGHAAPGGAILATGTISTV